MHAQVNIFAEIVCFAQETIILQIFINKYEIYILAYEPQIFRIL